MIEKHSYFIGYFVKYGTPSIQGDIFFLDRKILTPHDLNEMVLNLNSNIEDVISISYLGIVEDDDNV